MRRTPRARGWRLAASAALLALLSTACTGGSDAVDQTAGAEFRFVAGTVKGELIPAVERGTAPAVSAPRLDGSGSLDLATLRGKVVVLNFWASWCAPCRVEMPEFDAVYRATKRQGVEFVGVATKDREGAARAFVQRVGVSYPNVFDPTGQVTLRFRSLTTRAFPYTIVLDRLGRVAAVYLVPLLRGDIEPVVKQLAAER